MNDQRQAGFAGRGDVCPEAGFLQFPGAVVVVVIQPGLADPDDLGVRRTADEVLDRDDGFFLRLMRVNADGAPDIRVALRNGTNPVEPGHVGADRHHGGDTGVPGALNGFVAVFVKNVEIEVAVAVYKHAKEPSCCVAHCVFAHV